MIKTKKLIKIYIAFYLFFLSILFLYYCFDKKNGEEIFIGKSINFKIQITKENNLKLNEKQYDEETNIEEELSEDIDSELEQIDFSEIDKFFENFSQEELLILSNSTSFLELVKNLIYSDNNNEYNNFLTYFFSIIFKNITGYLPYFALIIALAIISSLLKEFSLSKNASVKKISQFACFGSVVLIVVNIIMSIISSVSNVIENISIQMQVIFPIILTLITAIGNQVTVATFQPILVILSAVITKLFISFLIPIFIFHFVFNIVGNLSDNVKLEKFSKFFSSLFNYVIGIIFTIFVAVIAIKGFTSSSLDGVSIKTAKYALKNYIPILGSYLSDGVNLIIMSSVLIKNAVGVAGLVVLLVSILSPIVSIIILSLFFKLTSAIIEPLGEDKISNFLFKSSKSLSMLNTCLIAIGFMYLISISILLACSNIF